jgi:hypothetical protein
MKGKGWYWRKWENFITELCDLVEGPSLEPMTLEERIELLRAEAEKVGAEGIIDKLLKQGKYNADNPTTS